MNSKCKSGCCALCDRDVELTFHHLIPRKLHRRNFFRKRYCREELRGGVLLCRECHRGIHKLYDEMTLGKQFYSLEQLRADPAISKHVSWVARQKRSI